MQASVQFPGWCRLVSRAVRGEAKHKRHSLLQGTQVHHYKQTAANCFHVPYLPYEKGLRLAEAAGLLKQDFVGLDTDQPYVRVCKHPWRNLKTASSARLVPLCGKALWAAKSIVATENNTDYAFPRYNRKPITAANSASAALNKWLKQYVLRVLQLLCCRWHCCLSRCRVRRCDDEKRPGMHLRPNHGLVR